MNFRIGVIFSSITQRHDALYMKNTGKDYENFVGSIYQQLLNSDQLPDLQNVVVEENKIIEDRNGIARQFDIYWAFTFGGHKYQTVIECKDYASKVTIEKIDAFLGKTNDIPGLKLIYVTKTGYQRGAKTKADQHKIDLMIARQDKKGDWVATDGTPLIKNINYRIIIRPRPKIISFVPQIYSAKLVQTNLSQQEIDEEFSSTPENEVFIKNRATGKSISLYDLTFELMNMTPALPYGSGSHKENLSDSYITNKNGNIKFDIEGYELTYRYDEPTITTLSIDLSEKLLGVTENASTGEIKMVYKDGTVTTKP